MLAGVFDFPVPRQVQFTYRGDDIESRATYDNVEPELIVSFSRTPVGNSRCLLSVVAVY